MRRLTGSNHKVPVFSQIAVETEAKRLALGDEGVLVAEGWVTREQAQEILGIGRTSLLRLFHTDALWSSKQVLASIRIPRLVVLRRDQVEELRGWLDEGERVVDALRGGWPAHGRE